MTKELKDLINKIENVCKVDKDKLRFAIHELSHAIIAVGKNHKLLKLELNKVNFKDGEVKVDYTNNQMINEFYNGIPANLNAQQCIEYKKYAMDYLEILAAGYVSEELFFDKKVDYSKNILTDNSVIYFASQYDGVFFHRTIANVLNSPIIYQFSYGRIISNVKYYLNSSEFQNILIKLLKHIYLVKYFGCCNKNIQINNIDINWINITIQDNYTI